VRTRSDALLAPIAVHAYFDKNQVWLRRPADPTALEFLRTQCGKGGLYVDNRPASFGQGYKQRLELRQPSPVALQCLAERDDVLINRVEIAS
jgi:hypothetical protein